MPIYEYACDSCEHVFDALQKMSDDALIDCPDCGKPSLRKRLSAPRFRLAGKGWYETDFKTDNKRNLAGDAEKSSTTGDKEPKKTDAGASAGKPAKVATKASPDKKVDAT